MQLPSFPKILALGNPKIQTIFDGDVEITEKIDGSQFSFGVVHGELVCRSKGARLVVESPDKLFRPAVEHVLKIRHVLPDGSLFFGETLKGPKHNVLTYGRVPKNNIILFGVWDGAEYLGYDFTKEWADILGVEVVPLLTEVTPFPPAALTSLLERESVLGNTKIEGIVVKNYARPYFITHDVWVPFMAGKYVSEAFKETHAHKAYGKRETKQSLEQYFQQFRTEARWRKALQHLREAGQCEDDPMRLIGPAIKEIGRDLIEEEQEEIKTRLWKEYEKQILRTATAGFPEWFKEKLMQGEI